MGIGECRPPASVRIACRARLRAGALGTDAEGSPGVSTGDGASARAQAPDIQGGHQKWNPVQRGTGHAGDVAEAESDVGGSPSHVQGDEPALRNELAQEGSRGDSARGRLVLRSFTEGE